ncbi:polysaccharide deacetylase family protein [bacterium]|nr:polysaccharide deacetylase family protein [bacterium]
MQRKRSALWIILWIASLLFVVACGSHAAELEGEPPMPGTVRITFELTVPEDLDDPVFITGTLPQWGPWDPAIAEMKGTGTTRQYVADVSIGTSIEYKFTLGTWQQELQDENGYISGNFSLEANEPTTVQHRAYSFGSGASRDADPDGLIKATADAPDIWIAKYPKFYETFLFPDGRSKAVVISMDDCPQQDRRFVALLNEHGLHGTFHLNSSRLVQDDYIGHDEVKTLYAGHEVSGHTVTHPWLTTLSREEIKAEVGDDLEALTEAAGYEIRGLSYPFGALDQETLDVLHELSVAYARTVAPNPEMALPYDPLVWPGGSHQSDAVPQARRLIDANDGRLRLLVVWGHAWELDGHPDGAPNSWSSMDDFCTLLEGHAADIWNPTYIEAADYIHALSQLEFNGSQVTNAAEIPVWLRDASGQPNELSPGATVNLAP